MVSGTVPENKVHSCDYFLKFEVVDTGKGISQEEKDKVFDPFFQANGYSSPQQGTGLGLSISRQFTQLMCGRLELDSKVGKGTRFTLSIPIKLTDRADTALSQPNRRVVGLAPGQPAFRILVVEDNEHNRNLLIKLLEIVGFDVRDALNGRDAIEIWKEWQPHLIWMDMRMPVMDGYKATSHIKTSGEGNGTVIIALTASAFAEDRINVIEHGCNDFVGKPFREKEIFEMMGKHLGVKYIYEEDAHTQTLTDYRFSNEEIKSMVAAMPKEMMIKLRKAASACDGEQVKQLINDVRIQNASLADIFSANSKQYAFYKIVNLIQKSL